MPLDGREGLREPELDGLGELHPQLLELLEALLEVEPLRAKILEPLLLCLVLLPGERIHHPEPGAPRLEPVRLRRELVAVVALRGLGGSRRLEPPPRLVRLAVDARELDLGRREPLARLLELLPKLDLGCPQPA